MMGPILISLLQTGIENGVRAGVCVGLGVWFSDFAFIGGVLWGLHYINQAIAWDGFELCVGICGGIVLIIIGLTTFLSKPVEIAELRVEKRSNATYVNWFVKGFLINSVNPFSVLFWISVLTTYVASDKTNTQLILFIVGIMATVMSLDLLKVVLAKKIRNRLKYKHVRMTRKISGAALIVFGLVLFVKVMV